VIIKNLKIFERKIVKKTFSQLQKNFSKKNSCQTKNSERKTFPFCISPQFLTSSFWILASFKKEPSSTFFLDFFFPDDQLFFF